MRKRRWPAIGAAGLVLVLALGGVSPARTSAGKGDKAQRAKYAELYRNRLAARLGVAPSKLDAARKGAIEDVIAQALKDGIISAEQAARLRERLAQDGPGEGFPGGWFFGKGHAKRHGLAKGPAINAAIDAVVAKLGIGRGELKQALRAGKSLEQVAKEHGTTLAALGKIAADAAKPVLDQMVAEDRITRARADEILAQLRAGKLLIGHPGFRRAA